MPKVKLEIGPRKPEETPEETRRRLRGEDKSIEQSRELDKKQPNTEYFGRKVQKVPIEQKRQRAKEEAQYNAQMDDARKELEKSYNPNIKKEEVENNKAA